jgi:uncharacterized protein YjdB
MAQYANQATYALDLTSLIAGAPSYTLVGQIASIDISGPQTDLLDGTAHGDEYRERTSGLSDGGTLTVTVRFQTDAHVSLMDEIGTHCAHRVQLPKACGVEGAQYTIESDGFITGVSLNAPHDGLFEATITVQLTGEPDVTEEVGVCSVAIDEPSQTLTHPDTLALSADVTATGGAATTVTWVSSDVAAATVSPAGLVTTVAAGTTVITATSTYDATITDSITITVA